MSQWCDYLHWYCTVAMNPAVTLEEITSGPSVITCFSRNNTEDELVRFGFLMKLYELCESFVLIASDGWALPEPKEVSLDGFYLLGGLDGSDYLVRSRGLCQPRAGGGVVVLYHDIYFAERSFASFADILKDEDNETIPTAVIHKTHRT